MTDKSHIATMFDGIATHYDFLNHLLSFNIDRTWRRKAVHCLKCNPTNVLDLATGTGDLAILLAKHYPHAHITGIDLSEKMLELGRKKIQKKRLENRISLLQGDAQKLPFNNGSFDALTVAFGVRNFENMEKSLYEMRRVLKPGAKAVILEFSLPKKQPIKTLYLFYFHRILPRLGKLISKNKNAYQYLPRSVDSFPDPDAFEQKLLQYGFKNCIRRQLSGGIAQLYSAHVADGHANN